ncbi:MAG: hypothetical protein QGG25_12585 [Phycisphaerae bacterium]|jgi:hypothetical protein|nr:hypothetical protein [Phycisphaerae bacterium]
MEDADRSIREFILTRLTLLSAEEGGRQTPIFVCAYQARYSPHIVIGDPGQRKAIVVEKDGVKTSTELYLGVTFWDGPKIDPLPTGQAMEIEMMLFYAPSAIYDNAISGQTFTLREGSRIIGFGEILDRWKQKVPQ